MSAFSITLNWGKLIDFYNLVKDYDDIEVIVTAYEGNYHNPYEARALAKVENVKYASEVEWRIFKAGGQGYGTANLRITLNNNPNAENGQVSIEATNIISSSTTNAEAIFEIYGIKY